MTQTESYVDKFRQAKWISISKVHHKTKQRLVHIYPNHVVHCLVNMNGTPSGKWTTTRLFPGVDFFACVSYIQQKFGAGKYLAVGKLPNNKKIQRTFTLQ